MTVNELLSLMKILRARVGSLSSLREEVSTKDIWMVDEKKVVEPQYDVKAVDRKITELETFLFKADAAIKQSNAVTHVTITVDVEKLLEPLS